MILQIVILIYFTIYNTYCELHARLYYNFCKDIKRGKGRNDNLANVLKRPKEKGISKVKGKRIFAKKYFILTKSFPLQPTTAQSTHRNHENVIDFCLPPPPFHFIDWEFSWIKYLKRSKQEAPSALLTHLLPFSSYTPKSSLVAFWSGKEITINLLPHSITYIDCDRKDA